MRKPKLIEDYNYLGYDAVAPFAQSVIRQLTTSPFIGDGADRVKILAAAATAYDADVAAVDHPTPAQTANRDLLRLAVITGLGRVGKRLNLDYPGDEVALLSSGLLMASTTGSTSTARNPAATETLMDFDVVDDAQSGYLLVKFRRPTGTIQNLVRYSFDEKLPEECWPVAVGGGRERQLGPFPSGTRVQVKAAALTASTTEPMYSGVKARIVQ